MSGWKAGRVSVGGGVSERRAHRVSVGQQEVG